MRDALDDVRALMAGLRPRLLEQHGLVVALNALAAMPPLWGTEVSVETQGIGEGERLPAEVELALFRIAQEAVSNARRHGAASRVRVSLAVRRGVAELLVVDDGRGFLWEPGVWLVQQGRGIAWHARTRGASGRDVAGRVRARGRDAPTGGLR